MAGDAYTERFDKIISDFPNKMECVDDTLMWAKNIKSSFGQTCQFFNSLLKEWDSFQFAEISVLSRLVGICWVCSWTEYGKASTEDFG